MAVDRESQQAEVDAILSRWEGIPLKEGSHEWSRARIRFIRDHLLTRTLGHLRRQGFKLTDPEIREARSWFRKELDGSLATYHSLPHLWKYKNLEWDFSTGNLKTVVAGVPQDSPIETRYGNAGPEGIRISRQSFQELLESNDQEKRDTVSEDDVVMAVSTCFHCSSPSAIFFTLLTTRNTTI